MFVRGDVWLLGALEQVRTENPVYPVHTVKKAWTGLQDGPDIGTLVATRNEIATSRAFALVGNKDGLLLAMTGACAETPKS